MSKAEPLALTCPDDEVLSVTLGVCRPGYRDAHEALGQASAGTTASPSAPFLAGSQAKMYTAACIGKLVRSGALRLNDEVRRFVPACPGGMDVRALLTHTSGLGDHVLAVLQDSAGVEPGRYTVAEFIAFAQRAGASCARGAFAYSNTGYLLLALLIERIGAEPLARFAARQIFDPIGMHQTCFIDHDSQAVQPLLRHQEEQLAADGCTRIRGAHLLAMANGSGNLLTSIDDSLRFGRALLAGDGRVGLELADVQGLEQVTLHAHRLWGQRAHFLTVSSATLFEPDTGIVAAYVVHHRCDPSLKPARGLLRYCEQLAGHAFDSMGAS